MRRAHWCHYLGDRASGTEVARILTLLRQREDTSDCDSSVNIGWPSDLIAPIDQASYKLHLCPLEQGRSATGTGARSLPAEAPGGSPLGTSLAHTAEA